MSFITAILFNEEELGLFVARGKIVSAPGFDYIQEEGDSVIVQGNSSGASNANPKTCHYGEDQGKADNTDITHASKTLKIPSIKITASGGISGNNCTATLKASNNADEDSGSTLYGPVTITKDDTHTVNIPLELPSGKYLTIVFGSGTGATSIGCSEVIVIEEN